MKVGESHRLAKIYCLACNKLVDGAACIGDDAKPSPGDMTICIYCGHLMAYNEQLQFRELTEAEVIAWAGDERILRIQSVRKRIKP